MLIIFPFLYVFMRHQKFVTRIPHFKYSLEKAVLFCTKELNIYLKINRKVVVPKLGLTITHWQTQLELFVSICQIYCTL